MVHSLIYTDELVSIVWRKASESNQIVRVLGSPLTLTGSWLVHRFPYRAPPEYEQSGYVPIG